MNISRIGRGVAAVAALSMALAACGGGGDSEGDATGDAIDLGGEPDTSVSGDITVLSAFTGDADVSGLQSVLDAFEEQYPDVSVEQEGSNSFEELARSRVGSGQAPDVIIHPQPGLLEDFYNDGANFVMVPPEGQDDAYVSGLGELTRINDDVVSVPLRLSLKSLVWYNKPAFDAGGYEIPETWDEMMQLTMDVAESGDVEAPWCIGIESDQATGWVATDWVEDILLRTIGPDQYDQWVTGELDFASDEVQGAIEEYMAPIWTNDDYVFGGQEQIARENFGNAVIGITTGEGGDCMLHRQATFIEGFISDQAPDAEYGTDYDFFFLPTIDEEFGDPALGAGDLAALYSDDPAAVEFMKFISTPAAGEGWAAQGGYVSPYADFDGSIYPTESARNAATLLTEATSFRFDGSDLMPADVGSSAADGSFWNEMTAWVTGQEELADGLAAIDETYDSVG